MLVKERNTEDCILLYLLKTGCPKQIKRKERVWWYAVLYLLFWTVGLLVSEHRIQLWLIKLGTGVEELTGTVHIAVIMIINCNIKLYVSHAHPTAVTCILCYIVDIHRELACPDLQDECSWLFSQWSPGSWRFTPWWVPFHISLLSDITFLTW